MGWYAFVSVLLGVPPRGWALRACKWRCTCSEAARLNCAYSPLKHVKYPRRMLYTGLTPYGFHNLLYARNFRRFAPELCILLYSICIQSGPTTSPFLRPLSQLPTGAPIVGCRQDTQTNLHMDFTTNYPRLRTWTLHITLYNSLITGYWITSRWLRWVSN